MDEQTLKVLARIFSTSDGKDLLEYIIKLKNRNYVDWKQEGGDVLRGKAICYDEIISLFENAENRILIQKQEVQKEWL